MKIPLIWLKDYITTEKTDQQIADSFTKLGLMLEKPIENKVLDLEHRFDRADWLGILWCARDWAAFEQTTLVKPKIYIKKGKPAKDPVDIRVESPDQVNRFNTRVFKNIKVAESPEWLKNRLEAYGMPVINNIVDITNFVMVETGQPLHAQDLAKFEKREIVIRKARDGESIVTLDGTNVNLDSDIAVLAQNDEPIVILGVVGGKKTSVTETTTEIVLDAGNYNQASIRKTSRKLKIQNETVLRCDKFLHPESTQYALQRATELILDLAGGEYYENYDYYPNVAKPKMMTLNYARLEKLAGFSIDHERVIEILKALDYKVIKKTKTHLDLEVPYMRTDVEVEDDLVADVLRINNYDNIPLQIIAAAPPTEITPESYKYEEVLRDALAEMGLHEHITDPLVKSNAQEKEQVLLENSLSSEKNALRTKLYDTLVPIAQTYFKHQKPNAEIFELGLIYKEGYIEEKNLQVVILHQNLSPAENSEKTRQVYDTLMHKLGIQNHEIVKNNNRFAVLVDGEFAGEIYYDGFNLKTECLMKAKKSLQSVKYQFDNLSSEDITVSIKGDEQVGEIHKKIIAFNKAIKSVYKSTSYKDARGKKTITFSVQYDKSKLPNLDEIRSALN